MDNKECEETVEELKQRIEVLEKLVQSQDELISLMLEGMGQKYDC
jgi:hypothetical protein